MPAARCVAFRIPRLPLLTGSLVVFDAEGDELGAARWYPRLDIAVALMDFADIPEEEAHAVEREVSAAYRSAADG
ncbi:MAG: hypothetical protein M3M94_05515 [Actinomycetota bacterium]|nr:hypothetical protein [Actinomycetota bacterium]